MKKKHKATGTVYGVAPVPGNTALVRVRDSHGQDHRFVTEEGQFKRGDNVVMVLKKEK